MHTRAAGEGGRAPLVQAPAILTSSSAANMHFKITRLLLCLPRAGSLASRSSQGGVEEDVGGRRLDGGTGHVRHLVVVELEPALLGVVPAVGCVVAAVKPSVVVLCEERRRGGEEGWRK